VVRHPPLACAKTLADGQGVQRPTDDDNLLPLAFVAVVFVLLSIGVG
jgi:hypothetical protein